MNSAAHQNPPVTINNNSGNKNSGNVTYSNKNVWNNCEISMSDEKRQILEWLSPLAPRERHQTVSEGRAEGVGGWLLHTNEFEKWHTSEDRAVNPVLFCYGDPGVGKTYMSSLVIDTLCDRIGRDNVAVACVYCDFHAQNEQSATTVLGALLKQVVAGIEPIPSEIKSAFESAKKQVDGRTLRLPEIRAMLVKSLSCLGRGYLCIDALDEFPQKNRPELWDSLRHIIRECPNTRLFITGRPHIQDEVGKYFSGSATVIPIKPRTEDIVRYLEMRLDRDPEADIMDESLRANILRVIPATISEIFLLVSLVVDAILDQATIHQRRETLNKMTNGLGLQDAYSATLDRIKEQKGSKRKLGMEALMWISRSERPLKAQELCHALAVEAGTTDLNVDNVPSIRTLLGCTLGLITIDQQSSAVRLIHFTLQEYLGTHANLFTTPHAMMAEICLTYLNFQSTCDLSPALRTIPTTTPFLHYASCYWGSHARKEETDGVKSLAIQLLQRDADHISASILLREESFGFLSYSDRILGRNPDLRGFTGLHCIAYMQVPGVEIAMVGMKRWDLKGCDSKGATPLVWAAKYGNYRLAKLLLEQQDVNPNLSDSDGLTPLAHAAMGVYTEVLLLLLDWEGVNPESLDNCGRTPLSYAASSGNEAAVKLLLDRESVNPDSSDKNGRTPLSYAARSGNEVVMQLLLDRESVNPDSSDKNGLTPLSYAANFGNEAAVKLLLDRETGNPDSLDENGRTPLSYAASSGNEAAVKLLLDRESVNPDSLDKDGRTPLSYAAGEDYEDVVKLLLDRESVNPDSSDMDGRTPLSYAAQRGREGVVKLLLDQESVNPDSVNKNGRTPLSRVAEYGSEDVVKLFLDRESVNPDSVDKDGWTPLLYAAGDGHEAAVKLLLDRESASPDSVDKDGRTPLSYAAWRGRVGMVKLLLDRESVNPDSVDMDGRTPLSYATGCGYEGVVKLLLDQENVNPDSLDENGRTPLSYAAQRGHEGMVKLLLGQESVNPDSVDKSGRTPLSRAAEYGSEDVVKLFLDRESVNPDSVDKDGLTPLLYAAWRGREGVMKLLLDLESVNPDSSDVDGRTPLFYAARSGNETTVKLLLDRESVNPDSLDKNGRTPLLYAALYGHDAVVKLLLDRESVNPDSSDKNGRTPLSYATQRGHEGVMKLLQDPGAFGPNESQENWQPSPPVCDRISDGLSGTLASQPEKHNPDPISEQSQLTPGLPATTPAEKAVPGPESAQQGVSPNTADKTSEEQAVFPSRSDQSPTNICPASLPAPTPTIWFFSSGNFFLSFIIILFAWEVTDRGIFSSLYLLDPGIFFISLLAAFFVVNRIRMLL